MNTLYITKPLFTDLGLQDLHYTDILTYITIRLFRNSETHNCYPAYETIALRMGASRSFVADSIIRLKNAGYIRIHKVPYLSNQYYFPPFDINDKIPIQIFELELSIYEKAMLLVIRQFCEGVFHQNHYNIRYMSRIMGLSYKTMHKQINSLIDKGYIEERVLPGSNKKCGFDISLKFDWYLSFDNYIGTKVTCNLEKLIIS